MNKRELAEAITKKTLLSHSEACSIIDGFTDAITEKLSKHDNVALSGFGTFRIKNCNARFARNPKTGQKIEVSAKKIPSFKVSKCFKNVVSKKIK